jgi:soluble lytic murein transglycosylase-like protein
LPRRSWGISSGVAVLIAAPVVATLLTTGSGKPVAVAPPLQSRLAGVERSVRDIANRPAAILRLHAPFPPPTPTPAPHKPNLRRVTVPASAWPHTAVVAAIQAAAARYGVDPNWMLRIAKCESGLRPNAYNPRGPYYGLFQFLMSTFTHNGGHNIWDPADQANVAAKMLAHGQAYQWACA